MVEYGGMGHTAVIHTSDNNLIEAFADRLMAGRIIVNAPATHGAIGDIYNTNVPSLTLGCGSYGRNATTANVSAVNLVNVKRVAKRRVNMQWFKIPEKIFFETGSIQYLAKMPGVQRAFIITDRNMAELGHLEKVRYHLEKRPVRPVLEVFSGVEPDPSLDLVLQGRDLMNRFQPDTIIALGGGSVIDAAKGMWLFYEHPGVEFEFLKLKFLDIRKRTYKYPKLGRRSRLVAIPTTSGSGSEVTAFAVITDRGRDIKYPLADYELTPDVAIIDPDLVETLPRSLVADTGLDVLAHGIEAFVSVMASDFTDALALKAIELVFQYLPDSWRSGGGKPGKNCIMPLQSPGWLSPTLFWESITAWPTKWEVNSAFPTGAPTRFFCLTSLPTTPGCPQSLCLFRNTSTTWRRKNTAGLQPTWGFPRLPQMRASTV